jgi:hypothetical protein
VPAGALVALTPLASQKRPLLLPGGRFLFGVPARILEALAQPKSFEPNAASGFAPGQIEELEQEHDLRKVVLLEKRNFSIWGQAQPRRVCADPALR